MFTARRLFLAPAHRALLGAALLAPSLAGAADWQPGAPLPAPEPRLFAVGLTHGGTLFAIGGSPFTLPAGGDAIVHYLPAGAPDWHTGASVEGPVVRQGAGIDALGRIVVFGGVDGTDPEGDTGQVYVYDIVEGQWQGLADRTSDAPDDYFAWATDDEHRIYSIGGGRGALASAAAPNSAHVERYLAGRDTWEVIAPMPHAVADGAAVHDGNGRILVFGGFDAAATMRRATVLSYDIASDVWSTGAVPDMPMGLTGHRAVLGADHRVYIMGGVRGPVDAGVTESGVLVLDLDSNTWSTGPAMASPRSHFAAMLSDDHFIVCVGGSNDSGGTASVEILYTPPCPVFTGHPVSRAAWVGHHLSLSASVSGGTPLSFQWTHDGVALVDGAQSVGAVSGAQSTELHIARPTAAASGDYVLIATNPCGAVASTVAVVTMAPPTTVPATWQVVNLHPAGALGSTAHGVSATGEGGQVLVPDATYGQLSHPVVWSGRADSMIDRTPAGSAGGSIAATAGDVQVGWWWWPYQCQVGGQWYTCYSQQACMWLDGVAFNLQYSGWEYSAAADTDGVQIVGTITTDDASGNVYSRAVLRPSLEAFWQVLHPPSGAASSGATALDAGRQYGWIHTPYPGPVPHAAMWSGSAASFVDLHPPGMSRSAIAGGGDGQQVGTAHAGDAGHAGLWSDSAASFTDLNPVGATSSQASDCAGGLQVGSAFGHAALWRGSAESYIDLHTALGAGYSGSAARGIHVSDAGVVRIVGSAYNTVTQRTEAILWIGGGRRADLSGDGAVDFNDLLLLLAAWGDCPDPCPPACPADLDDDCEVSMPDLLRLLAEWG
ncbi:MAG: hypothetical protein KF817_09095 [Phycisphaeraceae bacterium]|nr:hypothetical protein [Phycisphaeraceae bacterium]